MRLPLATIWSLSFGIALGLDGQASNPEYTLSLSGPCGETIKGLPGAEYDDENLGNPDFKNRRPGFTWDVVLTKTNSPPSDQRLGETFGWSWALGADGAFTITDVTTNGSISCLIESGPPCLGHGLFGNRTELTGLPYGAGPQTVQNHGAISDIILGTEGSFLPGDGSWIIAKIRVTATFPKNEGEIAHGQVYFTTRVGSTGLSISTNILYKGAPVTTTNGSPPLNVKNCEVFFKAVGPVDNFMRCEANNDGKLDLSDAVWILNELFLGGQAAACPIARDCDGDEDINISDAIFALTFLFNGGIRPSPPFPGCGQVDGLRPEDCPGGSTVCP